MAGGDQGERSTGDAAAGPRPAARDTEDLARAPTAVGLSPDPTLPSGPPAAVRELPPGTTLGRYVILGRLGGGGMGIVYTAHDPELDRRIALKLLRGDEAGASNASLGRERLLREAQAMARLSHENVIAVHDVGTVEGQVFIAMELVEGLTLRRWLEEASRPVRMILDVFVRAGRGLAAAHSAGLIHRDFKPDNVLVADDGRVRVVDFGLARAAAQPVEPVAAAHVAGATSAVTADAGAADGGSAGADGEARTGGTPASLPPGSLGSGRLAAPLTHAGAILGTPGYMAPEQLLGKPTDARSDQFSFAVALYQALYGELPFATDGEVPPDLAVLAGKLRPAPRGTRAPAWLRRVLRRALAPMPGDRYPSMEALLVELQRDPAARWRRILAGAAALALVAGGVLAYRGARRAESALCRGSEQRLAGVWDDGRKRAVAAAFQATGRPFAARAWAVVAADLDRYTREWAAQRTEACEATRVHGEQSAELFDLRMACLDARLEEVRALSDLFTHADAPMLERAVTAAHGLGGLAQCRDVQALRAPVRPPADSATRAGVAEQRSALARAKALEDAGRYADGVTAALAITAAARGLGYRPLEGEALLRLGTLQARAGDLKAAERTLLDATAAAEAGRHDAVAAAARIALVDAVGGRQARYEDGLRLAQQAAAAVERLGGDEELATQLKNNEATIYQGQGRFTPARELMEQVLAARTRRHGERHLETAMARHGLAVALWDEGKHAAALEHSTAAVAAAEEILGPEHPTVGVLLNGKAGVLAELGRVDEALATYRRSLAIKQAALGPAHPDVGGGVYNIGLQLHKRGRLGEALEHYQRALAIWEKAHGPNHPDLAHPLGTIGEVLTSQRKFDEARRHLERALAIRQKAQGPEHQDVATIVTNLAELAQARGRLADAAVLFARATAIREKVQGPRHPDVAYTLTDQGKVALAQRAPERALPPLERALAIRDAQECPPAEHAKTRFLAAQALVAVRRDRARALRLAEQARDAYAKVGGTAGAKGAAEVRDWLARHGGL